MYCETLASLTRTARSNSGRLMQPRYSEARRRVPWRTVPFEGGAVRVAWARIGSIGVMCMVDKQGHIGKSGIECRCSRDVDRGARSHPVRPPVS